MAVAEGTTTRPRDDLSAARFARETKPKIDPAEPEAIEDFLSANGICRRVSTVYLARPWPFTAKQIAEDREIAVAMAAVFIALEESRANYVTLAALLEEAYERLRAALQRRPDFELILTAAKREARP